MFIFHEGGRFAKDTDSIWKFSWSPGMLFCDLGTRSGLYPTPKYVNINCTHTTAHSNMCSSRSPHSSGPSGRGTRWHCWHRDSNVGCPGAAGFPCCGTPFPLAERGATATTAPSLPPRPLPWQQWPTSLLANQDVWETKEDEGEKKVKKSLQSCPDLTNSLHGLVFMQIMNVRIWKPGWMLHNAGDWGCG